MHRETKPPVPYGSGERGEKGELEEQTLKQNIGTRYCTTAWPKESLAMAFKTKTNIIKL